MPEVSIIIPCYNVRKEYLEECFDSIIAQSYEDFEIIVIDDGSEEAFRCKLEEFSDYDTRIKIYRQENKGVSAARNYGIKISSGNYICFIDADDYVLPNFLEQAVSIAKKTDAEILYSFVYRKHTDRKIDTTIEMPIVSEVDPDWAKKYLIGSYYKNGDKFFGRGPWARLIKNNIVKDHLFQVGVPIGEDILWNLDILESTKKRFIADTIWYVYEEREDSVTCRYDPNIADRLMPFYQRIEGYIKDKDDNYYVHSRILNDLRRYVFQLNLGNKENHDSFIIRWKNFIRMCKEYPWKEIGDKDFLRYASLKEKIKIFLFKTHFLFLVWSIKHRG